MTTPKYEELVESLTKTGVALRGANGEFRATYDIIADIAQQWDKMSSTEQAALITNIAGTRQQDIFQSLVRNFKEASGAMDAMSTSVGALSSAHATYLDSVEGRAQQLKATFEEFSQKLLSSEVYKGVLTLLSGVVDVLGKVLTSIGGLPTVILAITAALTILNLARIKSGIISIWTSLKSVVTFIPRVIQLIGLLTSQTMAETLATEAAAAGMTKFQVACASLNLNPVVLAISAIVAAVALLGGGIYAFVHSQSFEVAMERLEKSADELSETTNKLTALNDELSTTNQRIRELESKDSLTLVEQDELSKLKEANLRLKRQIELQEALNKAAQDQAQSDFVNAVSKWENEQGSGFSSDIQSYNWYVEQQRKGVDLDQADLDMMARIQARVKDNIEKLIQAREVLENVGYENLSESAQKYYDYCIAREAEFANFISGRDAAASVFFSSEKFAAQRKKLDQLKSEYSDFGSFSAALNSKFMELFSEDDVQAFADAIGVDLSAAYIILQQHVREYYAEQYAGNQEANNGLKETVNTLEDLKSKLSEVSQEIDNIQSAYDAVSSLINDFETTGHLSLDNLQKVLALEPEYLNLLIDENGQLNLNAQSYAKLAKAKLEDLLLSQIKTTFAKILDMKAEEAAAYATAQAYDEQTESIYGLIKAEAQLALSRAAKKNSENNTTAYTDAVERYIKTIPSLVSMVENYDFAQEQAAKATEKTTSTIDDQKSALDEQKEALEAQKEALEDSKDALEDYKNELSDAQSSIQSLIDVTTDFIKQMKEDEKDALNDQINALEKQKDALDEQKDTYADIIAKKKEAIELAKKEREEADELAEKQNAVAKDSLALAIAKLDDSSVGQKSQKVAADKYAESSKALQDYLSDKLYDMQITALEEEQKKFEENIDKQKELVDGQVDHIRVAIDEINDYLDKERKVYEDACAMIENDTGELYEQLWNYTYAHTTKTRAEFDHMWNAAQEAMERYGVAQNGIIGTMEFLQSEIYYTETQIADLDRTIDDVSGAIDSLNTSINNTANDGLANLSNRISDVRDEYQKLMEEMLAEINRPKKYEFAYGDRVYWGTGRDMNEAANAIWDIYKQENPNHYLNMGVILGGMRLVSYASGTTNARGGLSEVNEEGHEIRVLNKGDGIITAQITKNLSKLGATLGSNPFRFFTDVGKELLAKIGDVNVLGGMFRGTPALAAVGTSGNTPITIVNHINGDVNPSTLKALEKAEDRIVNKAFDQTMRRTLNLRNTNRIR